MYPIQGRYGLATYGKGFVHNRSIYNHIIELGNTFPGDDGKHDHIEIMTNFIVEYFRNQLLAEWKEGGIDANMQPDNWHPFGFHLVGFTKDANGDPVPHTHLIRIGKAPVIQRYTKIGCSWSGDGSVVTLLWQNRTANYLSFSLQDAVDYAKFLIRTTADFQRFSGALPSVGGEIDMALITNRRGFRWIAQKELYRILDREDEL